MLSPTQGENLIDDFYKIFWTVWQARTSISIGIVVGGLISILFAFSQPNIYLSQGVYLPIDSESSPLDAGSAYAGLASLAGVSLSTGRHDQIEIASIIMKSTPFLESLLDNEAVDKSVKLLHAEAGPLTMIGVIPEPRGEADLIEKVELLRSTLRLVNDKERGFVLLQAKHTRPEQAFLLVNETADALDAVIRRREMGRTEEHIEFLRAQVAASSLSDVNVVLYQMLEKQIQRLMLAKAGSRYFFDPLQDPEVPRLKHEPRRVLLGLIGAILGGLAGLLVASIGRLRTTSKAANYQ